MKIVNYNSLGYSTIFNRKTGFFARLEHEKGKEPFWAPHGPELIDISITNWCDKNCSFCYRKSDPYGQHMLFSDYKKIIDHAAKCGCNQVALGGGNPNQHPEFINILKYTHNAGIVPNYTTNGRGITDEIIKATAQYCGAVAISAYKPYNSIQPIISAFVANSIKTNIHFLLDNTSINLAIDWLKSPPSFLRGINAIVFLNYKPIGRKVVYNKLLKNSAHLNDFFNLSTKNRYPFKIGFDACCISGLVKYTDSPNAFIDACDAGRFSMFISEDMKAYPCSFQKEIHAGDPIPFDGNFSTIWRDSENFKKFRDYFHSDKCYGCEKKTLCMNGCPIFDELPLCGKATTKA